MKLVNRQTYTVLVVSNHSSRLHRVVIPIYILISALTVACGAFAYVLYNAWNHFDISERLEQNKKLQGENFKLKQELEKARSEVESMEWNLERVQNYVRKLQNILHDDDPISVKDRKGDRRSERGPASEQTTSWDIQDWQLHTGRLEKASYHLESTLSNLQYQLREKTDLLDATPSLMPINGWISSPFGIRRHPFDGELHNHRGIDLVADSGTPVRAPASGRVFFSGQKEGYGKVIVLDHGYGFRTLFGHNAKLFVHYGDVVKRGDVISEVGSTGMSTGPHLHYEVRKNGQPVNPVRYLPHVQD